MSLGHDLISSMSLMGPPCAPSTILASTDLDGNMLRKWWLAMAGLFAPFVEPRAAPTVPHKTLQAR